MRTVGVDLAAEPRTTAVAVIEWRPGTAQVSTVRMPADDSMVLDLMDGADKVGIDYPLGWPDAFVQFVTAHHNDALTVPDDLTSVEWRRSLSYRFTDEHVRTALSMIPLSVSTDRIGVTAMRRLACKCYSPIVGIPSIAPALAWLSRSIPQPGCGAGDCLIAGTKDPLTRTSRSHSSTG
jgi:predicted nuclease with RNAse H fold